VLPGILASPRTGLPPAGWHKLVARFCSGAHLLQLFGARASWAHWGQMRLTFTSTCPDWRSKLSLGPYKFVGINEIASIRYCLRYILVNSSAAIFAMAPRAGRGGAAARRAAKTQIGSR
jgi:hypothetical protein